MVIWSLCKTLGQELMTSDCNFSCCICQKSGFHSDKNQQELLQSSTTEAAGRGGMLDGVFYSGNRRCLWVNDGGRRGRPSAALGWRGISRFSSQPGRRSKPSRTSDSGCCRHRWAAASQTLHSPTLPPLVSPPPPLSRLAFYHRRCRRSLSQSLAAGCFSSAAARHEESAG